MSLAEFLEGDEEWEPLHHTTYTSKGWFCTCGESGHEREEHVHGPHATISDFRIDQ